MSLLKRGNIWWSYFFIDGVRHQISTGTSNKRQADAIEQKLKDEANARRFQLVQTDPRMTVGDLVIRFVAEAHPKVHHTAQLKTLLPYFGDVPVMSLNRNMAHDYRQWRHKQKAITDATVNRALSVLRHILYWAVDGSLIPSNPMARVPLVRERRIRRSVISLDEEDCLLPALPEYLRRITIAALDTGMRRGEILKQRWEDIDLNRRLLSVTKSKTAGGEGREIPLTERLRAVLAEAPQTEGVVFTFHGGPLSWIRKGWLGGLKRAKLRHFRFHDLRHTFNTRLMEAGVMQEIRMALMGHSSGEKVHSIYTHVELPVKREAIARLQQWVQKQRQGGQHGDEIASSDTSAPVQRPQTVEEENPGGSGS